MYNYHSIIEKDAASVVKPPAPAHAPEPAPQPLAFDADFPDGAKKCSVTVPCFFTTHVTATSHKQAMGNVMKAVEAMTEGVTGEIEGQGVLELCQVEHSADTIAIPLLAVVNLPAGTVIPKDKLLQVCLNIIDDLNQKHTKGGITFNALLPTSGEVTGSDDF